MNGFIYEASHASKGAQKEKWKRILTPLLKDILDEDALIKIDIDKQNNLCINNAPIGDIEFVSNFRNVYSGTLSYDYHNKPRCIDFEEIYDFHKPPRKKEVQAIYELMSNGSLKLIYKK